MKKWIMILGCLLILGSCCWPGNYWIDIDQKVKLESILKRTCEVRTYIWVNSWDGMPIELVMSWRETVDGDCFDCIKNIKSAQLAKANEWIEKVGLGEKIKQVPKCGKDK